MLYIYHDFLMKSTMKRENNGVTLSEDQFFKIG